MSKWTLFSNHGHVLVVLSRDPDARLRDVAQIVGITERAVQKIVRDLQDGGLVGVTKHGRRNRYRLRLNQPLRHTLEAHCTIGELLEMVNRHAPGLETEEEPPEPAFASAPAPAPPARTGAESAPQGAPPESAAPGTSTEAPKDTTPASDDKEDEAPTPKEPDRTPRAPRRKISPADDGEQGSLF